MSAALAGGHRHDARGRWLFLVPEIERLAPALVAALAAPAGVERTAAAEARRVEALIAANDEAGWFALLRDYRALADRAEAAGADPALVARLRAIVHDQYLLAPSVHPLDAVDEDELRRLDVTVLALRSGARP